ncbi:MAG: hypothetical protein JW702_04460 [Clostridiales bacterium]|nr:hypothetical protein [Clostridiales bacterium]
MKKNSLFINIKLKENLEELRTVQKKDDSLETLFLEITKDECYMDSPISATMQKSNDCTQWFFSGIFAN